MIIDSRFRGNDKEGGGNDSVQCKLLCQAQKFTPEILYLKYLLNNLSLFLPQFRAGENVKHF